MWFDLFVTSTLLLTGSVLFGHFEMLLPPTRRLGKLALTLVLTGIVSAWIGHWSLVFVAALLALSIAYHYWWCVRHDVDPVTAEPWDTFVYHLREKYGTAVRDWP